MNTIFLPKYYLKQNLQTRVRQNYMTLEPLLVGLINSGLQHSPWGGKNWVSTNFMG
jgi:hypothetical protein